MKSKYLTVHEVAEMLKVSYDTALNFVKKKTKYIVIGKQYRVLESKLNEDIATLIELSKSSNCDFFMVKEKLYRFEPNHYYKLEKNILQLLDYQIKVECKNHH